LQRPYFWLERLLARWTDVVISVNEADRQRLIGRRVAAAEKVITVYCGIDVARFRSASSRATSARRVLGVPDGVPLVVQIGRLHVQKGPTFFVEAAQLVLQQHPQVYFALVGEGPLQDALSAQIAALGIADRVSLAGWHSDAAGIMAAADVLVLASLWEGLPLTLLESMAVGCPVVVTDVNGCREAVMDDVNGLLVPSRDVPALAAAIERVLGDRALAARLVKAGRKTVEERFSLSAAATAVHDVYAQVLTGRTER
jgi:glycosyltransferase involved in cell wall biosynthesis